MVRVIDNEVKTSFGDSCHELKNSQPIFIMLVGPACSGKTTYAHSLEKEGCRILSPYATSKRLWYNRFLRNNDLIKTLENDLFDALHEGENCVYDATNLTLAEREHFLAVAKAANPDVYKVCVVMSTDEKECIKRDKNREYSIGQEKIKEQFCQLEMPKLEEGWELFVLN